MDDDGIIGWVLKMAFTDFRQLRPNDEGANIYRDGENVGKIVVIVDDHCYISHSSGVQEMKPFIEAQYLYQVPADGDEDDREGE